MLVSYLFILPTVLATKYNNHFISDYFNLKRVNYVSILHCDEYESKIISESLIKTNIRVISLNINRGLSDLELERLMRKDWLTVNGYLVNFKCENSKKVLKMASHLNIFNSRHNWLVTTEKHNHENYTDVFLEDNFAYLNLSVDSDVVVSFQKGLTYELIDVFNYGKIQGNQLETERLGIWSKRTGLEIDLKAFKYYDRWDFHNLTLRAITVILGDARDAFRPEMLTDVGYTEGISAMTKISCIIVNILKDVHNFRLSYTVADRWVGSPEKNSSLSVTNTLHWKDHDISCTCLRIFTPWLDWMDAFFPSTTMLETKFYYRIPNKGIGEYENRFLQPLSPNVWWGCLIAFTACGVVLGLAAYVENRPRPVSYAFFSVSAAACQQEFEDGEESEKVFTSQGRRLILFVIGCSSVLLYNYYTSSVVSWLLNAAPPSIANIDGLIESDLELIFEDIGYTRSWLDSAPGFFYYKGFKYPKEDELREKRVRNGKRTIDLLQNADDGIKLVRQGGFAYHTEPYNANRRISRSFDDSMLCELGALQMMPPSQVYIMGQRHSPYKKFFVWSLIRALERGHISYVRRRISGEIPRCSGGMPRALSLGQAAPAFALLAYGAFLAYFILFLEIICHTFGYKLYVY